ncbi:hypothetical protein LCGC14_0967930 [marine sediment metagenome]|uniref:Uncharacterized protein n=1 Tax=marine sediment metagenome TaxID=412755 RepID=A0A0F9NGZ7_9ZZZZ|nr:MAG: hypothetical protein Lokiarch_35850 [Candidatus Lokiarchaeum sp. GC14_75]
MDGNGNLASDFNENFLEIMKNWLNVFTRPEKVTEEEVSVSKEKKICLVCKNKIARDNYICPDCNIFYCFICKSALIDVENVCWACNAPIDPSKPVKLDKEKEEEIDVKIFEKLETTANQVIYKNCMVFFFGQLFSLPGSSIVFFVIFVWIEDVTSIPHHFFIFSLLIDFLKGVIPLFF